MFGVVILPVQFGRGLFCFFIFIFFYIDDKEKVNLSARSSQKRRQSENSVSFFEVIF